MKILHFFLIVVLFSCCCLKNQAESSNKEIEYNIYLEFKSTGFNDVDFKTLQNIANRNIERLDIIPNNVAYRLTSQDTTNSEFFCRNIDAEQRRSRINKFGVRSKSCEKL